MKARKRIAKTVVPAAAEQKIPVFGPEENLARLSGTDFLKDFVWDNFGSWDHQKWLMLCGKITEMGYVPIDFDQVGLILEKEKSEYLSSSGGVLKS